MNIFLFYSFFMILIFFKKTAGMTAPTIDYKWFVLGKASKKTQKTIRYILL